MKNASKWIVTHEPLIFAGLFFGVATFLGIRYGAHASAVVQAQSGGIVALAFGLLRNFVTSPASRASLDDGVKAIPGLVQDVGEMSALLGPAFRGGGGLAGVLEHLHAVADAHGTALKTAVEDAVQQLHGIVRANTPKVAAPVDTGMAPAAAVIPPVSEPPTEPPAVADPVAALADIPGTPA